jgi:hypothetical protein
MQDELARLSDSGLHVVAPRSNHDVPASHSGQSPVIVHAVRPPPRARDHACLIVRRPMIAELSRTRRRTSRTRIGSSSARLATADSRTRSAP